MREKGDNQDESHFFLLLFSAIFEFHLFRKRILNFPVDVFSLPPLRLTDLCVLFCCFNDAVTFAMSASDVFTTAPYTYFLTWQIKLISCQHDMRWNKHGHINLVREEVLLFWRCSIKVKDSALFAISRRLITFFKGHLASQSCADQSVKQFAKRRSRLAVDSHLKYGSACF